MRKLILGALSALTLSTVALAQTSPGLRQGQVPTAAQWNSYFSLKQDALGFTPLNRAGGTMSGPLITAPSTAASSGLRVPTGSGPTAPSDGDIWVTSSGFSVRVNGTTLSLTGASSGLTSGQIFVGSVTNTATGVPLSGDCTLVASGAITCTKSNGVSFSPVATSGSASDLSAGTLPGGRFPALVGGDVTGTAGSLVTTVVGLNGVALGSTTATSGNILVASGSQWVSVPMSGNVSISSSGVTSIGNNQVTNSMLLGAIDASTKLTNEVPIANGGTGAGSAAAALSNLGAVPLAGGTMTGALLLNADPAVALGAATKQYVDNVTAGVQPKAAVDAASTINLTLSGSQTVDGTSSGTGRYLIKNQTAPAENGIYDANTGGAWTRSTDADTWSEVVGAQTFVQGGSTQSGTQWITQVTAGGTIGTTAMPWVKNGATTIYSAGAGLSLSGSVFSVATNGVNLATMVTGTLGDSHLPSSMATKTFTGTTAFSGPVQFNGTSIIVGGSSTPQIIWTPTSGATKSFQIFQVGNVAQFADAGIGNRMSLDLATGNLSITGSFSGGSISATGAISMGNSLASSALLIGSAGSYIGRSASDGSTVFNSAQANIFFATPTSYVFQTGNIGVGLFPEVGVRLEVLSFDNTASTPIVKVLSNNQTAGVALYYDGVGSANTSPFGLKVNGSAKVWVLNSGAVGVGTASPTATFSVIGTSDVTGAFNTGGIINTSTSYSIGAQPFSHGLLHAEVYGCVGNGSTDNVGCWNAMVAACTATTCNLVFPPGRYAFSTSVGVSLISGQSLAITGAADGVTELYFPGGTDGVQINYSTDGNAVTVKDLSIVTTSVTVGVALRLTGASCPIQFPPTNLTRVFIHGNANAVWAYGIVVNTVPGVRITNLTWYGSYGAGANTGIGASYVGVSGCKTIQSTITDSTFNWGSIGVLLGEYVEGTIIKATHFTGAISNGVYQSAPTSGGNHLAIIGSEFETSGEAVVIANNMLHFIASDNLLYIQSGHVGFYTPGALGMFTMTGNTFASLSGGGAANGVYIANTFGANFPGVITGNEFDAFSAAVVLAAGSSYVTVVSNAYGANNGSNVVNSGSNNQVGGAANASGMLP